MAQPTIIIPDTAPLIHLAAGNLLHLLPALGRVVVPDVIVLEATRLPDKPWSREITAWLTATAIEIVETDWGPIFRQALAQGLKLPRDGGELSILFWLDDNADSLSPGTIVVYEDTRVPRRFEDKPRLRDQVIPITTRDFLELAEARGVIPSALDALDAIAKNAPTVSRASALPRRPAP